VFCLFFFSFFLWFLSLSQTFLADKTTFPPFVFFFFFYFRHSSSFVPSPGLPACWADVHFRRSAALDWRSQPPWCCGCNCNNNNNNNNFVTFNGQTLTETDKLSLGSVGHFVFHIRRPACPSKEDREPNKQTKKPNFRASSASPCVRLLFFGGFLGELIKIASVSDDFSWAVPLSTSTPWIGYRRRKCSPSTRDLLCWFF
jgi:hypothetical protein